MESAYRANESLSRHVQTTRQAQNHSTIPIYPAGQDWDVANQPVESVADIEQDILHHPESMAHFKAVSLCLRIDIYYLRSMALLRSKSLWSEDLAEVYGPLLSSPPPGVFKLILNIRSYTGFDPRGLLERLQLICNATSTKSEAGRTAPEGQRYKCPSLNCRELFKKCGHAQNHVKSKHPEYLTLHPGYQPQQFLVDDIRSGSTSPEAERQPLSQIQSRQRRPRHNAIQQDSVPTSCETMPRLSPESTRHSFVPSPHSFDIGSPNSFEDRPQLSHSRSTSRPSPRPVTPRDLARHEPNPFIYLSPGSLHAKRGRDPYSSTESVIAYVQTGDNVPTGRPRRQSRRLSVSNPYSNWS